MQFCMHFHEAYKSVQQIPPSSELNDNEQQLSKLLYHVPAMCNAKLHGTDKHTHTHTHTHIHTHTHTILG